VRRPTASADGWRSLRVEDGALWHGDRGAGGRDPCVRFDPDGLTVVEPDGRRALMPWADHAAAAPIRGWAWWLEIRTAHRRSVDELVLVVTTAAGPHRRRLAGSGRPPAAWPGLPALAAHFAATPGARPGLADPARIGTLRERIARGATGAAFDALEPDRFEPTRGSSEPDSPRW
jgi:hypothetical protein